MKKIYFLLTGLLAFLFVSCEKDNPIEKQDEQITAYIKRETDKDNTLKKDQIESVYYLFHSNTTSEKPQVSVGDSVYFDYLATLVSDTLAYFDTNVRELGEILGLTRDPASYGPTGVIVGNNSLIAGLQIGLKMVHEGDVGTILFTSDYGYGDKGNGTVPPNSALIFKVAILRVKKN